jgi:hypothetical protein
MADAPSIFAREGTAYFRETVFSTVNPFKLLIF